MVRETGSDTSLAYIRNVSFIGLRVSVADQVDAIGSDIEVPGLEFPWGQTTSL